jgi:rhodanese-related sulfurtransferase
MRGNPCVLAGIPILLALAACQTQLPGAAPPAAAGFRNLGPVELSAMLAQEDVFFVNTHIPYEGEISGTDAFIPYNEIDRYLDQLPADREARIVLYCRSGRMSAIAGETLANLGYSDVWNLEGGMIAWEEAGLPIEVK